MLFFGFLRRHSVIHQAVSILLILIFQLPSAGRASGQSIGQTFHSFSVNGGSGSSEYSSFTPPGLDRHQLENDVPGLASRLDMADPNERLLTVTWSRPEPSLPDVAPDQLELCLKGAWSGTFLSYYWSPRITVTVPAEQETGTVTKVVANGIDPGCSRFVSGNQVWWFHQAQTTETGTFGGIHLLIAETSSAPRQKDKDNVLPVLPGIPNKGQTLAGLLSGGGGVDDDYHQDFRPGGGLPSEPLDIDIMPAVLLEEETPNGEGDLPGATDVVIRYSTAWGLIQSRIISAAQWAGLWAVITGQDEPEDLMESFEDGDENSQTWLSGLRNIGKLLQITDELELETLVYSSVPGMLECSGRGAGGARCTEGRRPKNTSGSRSGRAQTARSGHGSDQAGASGQGGGGGQGTGIKCRYCTQYLSDAEALKFHLLSAHLKAMSPEERQAVIMQKTVRQSQAASPMPNIQQGESDARRVASEQNARIALTRASALLRPHSAIITGAGVLQNLYSSLSGPFTLSPTESDGDHVWRFSGGKHFRACQLAGKRWSRQGRGS